MSRRASGPSPLTVDVVISRDRGQCAHCRSRPFGDRGFGWSIHHRRPRGMGGAWHREDTNSPANLVILCGTGTGSCHGWAESNRLKAFELGLLVRQTSTPSQVPIHHAVHGICWLTDDGEWVTQPPMEAA